MTKHGFPTLRLFFCAAIALLLCFGGLPTHAFADPEPQNVSSGVNISGVEVYVKQDGVDKLYIDKNGTVDTSITIKVGNTVSFKSFWNITSGNMTGLKAGDFFEILLPSSYFTFFASTSSTPIPADGVHVADMDLLVSGPDGPRLRLTLTDEGAQANELKNGWVTAVGRASDEKDAGETVTVGGVVLPSFPIEPADPSGGGGLVTHPWTPGGPILKSGYQSGRDNTITWTLNANFDEYAKVYSGGSATQKNNVVITDTLESGLVLNSVTFASTYYYPHDDGTLSKSLAYSPTLASGAIVEIIEDPNDTYASFYDKVVGATGPSYGVYQNKELIVSLKNFPDSLTMGYTWTQFKEKADKDLADNKLTQAQYDKFIAAYKNNFYKNGSTAQLIALSIGLNTTAYGSNRDVSNSATMTWNNGESSSSNTSVQFQSIAGGASLGIPGSVVIRKFDGMTDEKLNGAKFKLQKKNSNGEYVDYTPRDSIVERETIDGEIIFEELHYGDYRVVETVPPTGYAKDILFKDDKDTFTIDGTETGAIFIEAYNYPTFVQSNTASFVAQKQVSGTASFEPRDFHFVIVDMGDGSTVAYGKTFLSSKNEPMNIDFFTDQDYQTPIKNWENIFAHGSRYKLEEVDGAGYDAIYEGGGGESSNEFLVDTQNSDFSLAFFVDNTKNDPAVPVEETPIDPQEQPKEQPEDKVVEKKSKSILPKTSDWLISTVALTIVLFSLITAIAALRRKRLRA